MFGLVKRYSRKTKLPTNNVVSVFFKYFQIKKLARLNFKMCVT
jgi:hypothetical protein